MILKEISSRHFEVWVMLRTYDVVQTSSPPLFFFPFLSWSHRAPLMPITANYPVRLPSTTRAMWKSCTCYFFKPSRWTRSSRWDAPRSHNSLARIFIKTWVTHSKTKSKSVLVVYRNLFRCGSDFWGKMPKQDNHPTVWWCHFPMTCFFMPTRWHSG